jgi:hypothetical protein
MFEGALKNYHDIGTMNVSNHACMGPKLECDDYFLAFT